MHYEEENYETDTNITGTIRKNVKNLFDRCKITKSIHFNEFKEVISEITPSESTNVIKNFVTENVAQHVGFGENLLEVIYKDISIDTDDEKCPKCGTVLLDDDVVRGWVSDAQSYTTSCPTCTNKFVPKFRVQTTSSSIVGSKGPGEYDIF